MKEHYKFTLKPLPYRYYDIEPYISEQTMKQHHIRHLGGYIISLNSMLERMPQYQSMSLTELYSVASKASSQSARNLRFLCGAVYNHNLFFSLLSPTYNDAIRHPSSTLAEAISDSFGSFENFMTQFRDASLSIKGAGWMWLCRDSRGRAVLAATQNHDIPHPQKLVPIILLDMWEHAYYLDNLDKKKDYVENFFRIINWQLAQLFWDSKIIYK